MLKHLVSGILVFDVTVCTLSASAAEISSSDKQTFVPIYDKWTKSLHGLDVLKPDAKGNWRIVNWVAYSDQGKPK